MDDREDVPRDPRDLRQVGFKSGAAEYIREVLSLDKRLIRNPAATFFWRVKGDELRRIGLRDGDLLVVDRSEEARHDNLAVCVIEGQFRIRRLRGWGGVLVPVPLRNSTHLDPLEPAEVWGVVKAIIREV